MPVSGLPAKNTGIRERNNLIYSKLNLLDIPGSCMKLPKRLVIVKVAPHGKYKVFL